MKVDKCGRVSPNWYICIACNGFCGSNTQQKASIFGKISQNRYFLKAILTLYFLCLSLVEFCLCVCSVKFCLAKNMVTEKFLIFTKL